MLFLQELLTPIAAMLHLPIGIVVFAVLIVIGALGHFSDLSGGAQTDHSGGSYGNPVG